MYSYGKSSYNRRYDIDNNHASSLSNVYRDLMSSNKESPIISQYDYKKSSNYNNFPTNYHFVNRNNIRSQYKSMSPPLQNSQYSNKDLSSNISKNFFSNYGQEKNSIDTYNRNRSFDNKNNVNKSSSNIFSYNNNNNNNSINNFSSFSNKNFYDTITNFGNENSNKIINSLYNQNKENDNYDRNKNNYNISTYKPESIYKNYFDNNRNTNYSNNIRPNYYSKSPGNNNIKSYDSKNEFFTNRNNYDYSNNLLRKSSNFEEAQNRLYKGYSLDNIHNRNSYNNNKTYKITNYSASTMAGTNGYGITKTNQDSYIIKLDKNNNHEDEYTFGVFDGHGSEGHLVSQAIKQFFTNCSYFDFNTKSLIFQIFSSLSNIINNSQYFDSIGSGSTVVLVHINPEKIISINCGDSRAILITKNKNIISLTRDHKPELADERERIEASGGRIDKIYGMGPYRVWFKNEDYPGLAMSRSIGDKLAHKVGVSDVPEIKEFNISDVDPLAIVVASDGVWEFMSNEEVRNLVMNYAYSKDANLCAKTIVEKARVVWQGTGYAIDDITCVVGFFNE
jgi:serine/threonine protein phosphatase PrpC